MKFHILYIFCTLAVKSAVLGNSPKIGGGEDAYPGQFPWMVSLQQYYPGFDNVSDYWWHTCGGAIIDSRHVISSAECAPTEQIFRVLVGAHNISDENEPFRKSHKVCRTHIHPEYNNYKLTNNMMVLTLTQSIAFNERVQPIRLGTPAYNPVGQVCVVSGWGWTDVGLGFPQILQISNQTVVSLAECRSWDNQGPFIIDSSCVCTKPEKIRGGDYGGALVCYDDNGPYAHGVVSWNWVGMGGVVHTGVKSQLDFIMCRNSTGGRSAN